MTDKPTITQGDKTALDEAVMECVLGDLINGQVIIAKHRESAVAELQAEVDKHCLAIANEIENPNGRTPLQIISAIALHNARARAALAQKEPVE